ncbi:hypothetical protein KP509_21G081100 [Ceratopteris richardii]|uniref:Cns1/TTC4 wheel domain-containing protein n=1 Tax=Ceratopteris richardii TaxID=49495 RepID=A0A8T2SF26_CERRI|nr:hypothetical protein KP509_21G081100 [Ceratopteris richardii]
MALWLEPDSENITPEAQTDLDALSALRESAAIELKEKGNEYVKLGKKYYKDAIDCYSRAIQQKSMDAVNTSILHANRAQVHLLLGNNRHALDDAQQAITLNKANVKACFRGAKAALALGSISEAIELCSLGLKEEPENMELSKLKAIIENKAKESAAADAERASKVAKAQVLASIILDRGVSVGNPDYEENTAHRRPWLDDSKLLHWPVLLLYPESMASDFIEDFCEFDTFAAHLDNIFGPDVASPAWDSKCNYTREKVRLFYKSNKGPKLSKGQLLGYLLEGKSLPTEIKDVEDINDNDSQPYKYLHEWKIVPEKSSLHDILARKDHIIPGIPVFYVLSKGSSFYDDFLSGHW